LPSEAGVSARQPVNLAYSGAAPHTTPLDFAQFSAFAAPAPGALLVPPKVVDAMPPDAWRASIQKEYHARYHQVVQRGMSAVIDEPVRSKLDAIELLMQDQREVECLFREFEYLHTRREETDRVVKIACAELRMHDTLNTEFFFPAVLEAGDAPEIEGLVAASEDAQREIRDLLTRIEQSDADHEQRDAQFSKLATYVGRHFNEAETNVFPRAKALEGLDLISVADRMKARKSELLAHL
jgi:hypothetical protein